MHLSGAIPVISVFFSFSSQEWHQEEPNVYMVIVGPEVS